MKEERRLAVVILAAGMGTRMKSDLPKVLHLLNGTPLIVRVAKTASLLTPAKMVAIVGHRRELVMDALKDYQLEYAVQEPQLGTGHAVLQAEPALSGFNGRVMVLSGDVPLLRQETLELLIRWHEAAKAAVTVLSTKAPDPAGYGRIVRDKSGDFAYIIEERDATDEERAIHEINSGVYCFESDSLFEALRQIKPDNSKGEYYLTDAVGILKKSGAVVQALDLAEFWEVRGINTLEELNEAESLQAVRLAGI